jgi:hypothetical protein
MNASRDPDAMIRAFIREGEEQLNDQVYDAVRASIEQKRQRALIGPWRTPTMNKFVTIGLGAAAVVVLLFVGVQLLGSGGGGFGTAPSPSTEPTATPDPTSTPEPAGLPDGPHLMVKRPTTGASITVTIAAADWHGTPGEGWVTWGSSGGDGPTGAGVLGYPEGEYYVYGDPCAWSSTRPDTPATTVDELVDALANQRSREASATEEITVDGYAGKKIILDMAEDVPDFFECDQGTFGLFGVPEALDESPYRYSQDPGQTEEVWAVDVDGVVVVNIGVYYPDTPQHVIDEVRAILASATFDLP